MSYRNYSEANGRIVDTTGHGDFTTLASAMAAASSGQTIFLATSVTENVTLTPGVNITGWTGGTLNVPTITGTLTMTGAGTCNLSGLNLTTNGAAIIAVTGSAASILNINDCYLNCSNNTGITFSSSNASASINIKNCRGDLGTTGIAYFSHSSAGTLSFLFSQMENSGSSITASTISSGGLFLQNCRFTHSVTSSSTGFMQFDHCSINAPGATNQTMITHGGSASNSFAKFCSIYSGSASAISIGSTFGVYDCNISSTNTNAITGAGVLNYSSISFSNTSKLTNVSTQTGNGFNVGSISFDNGVNNLSAYSEGTWSPTMSLASAGTSSWTYSAQVGRYCKIGNVVWITGRIILTNYTIGTGSGNFQFSSLPFTVANVSNQSYSFSVWLQTVTFDALVFYYSLSPNTNSTIATFVGVKTAATVATMSSGGSNFVNTSQVITTGMYSVA